MPEYPFKRRRGDKKRVFSSKNKLKEDLKVFADGLSRKLASEPVHVRPAEWMRDVSLFILHRLPLETTERLAAERIIQRSAKIAEDIAIYQLADHGVSVGELRRVLADAEQLLEISKKRQDPDTGSKTRIIESEKKRLEGRHPDEHLDVTIGTAVMAKELVAIKLAKAIGNSNYNLYNEHFFSVRNKLHSIRSG